MTELTSKIPKRHGDYFFEPPLPQWKEEAFRNRERLIKQMFWGQAPLKVREALKLPTGLPLILSGHQPIFFHPGVWAKCLAASILAEAVSGTACHKITDTAMTSEYFHFVPEVEDNGKARRKQIDFFSSKDMKNQEKTIPYAYLAAPEFNALEKIFSEAQIYSPDVLKPVMADYREKLIKSLKKEASWNDYHLSMLKILDEICGTTRLYLYGSKLWSSPPFQQFAAQWLMNLPEMTENYNAALDEYRKKYGITHDLSPLPNLKFENWWFEVPFWGVTKYHQRHSLWAKKDGSHVILRIKGGDGTYSLNSDTLGQEIGTLAIDLWPKAVPQTLFCRMYLCDFFIHGTGGASYEEIGDALFMKVLKVKPPAYGVATSTYLVDPKESRALENILGFEEKIQLWQRALAQNPEYLFTKSDLWQKDLPSHIGAKFKECLDNEALRKLAAEKGKLVESLKDPARREEASRKIKQVNFALYDGYTEALKALEQGMLDVGKLKETRDVLGFREYPFFCFQPQVFVDMRDKIRKAAHLEKEPQEAAK